MTRETEWTTEKPKGSYHQCTACGAYLPFMRGDSFRTTTHCPNAEVIYVYVGGVK